MVFLLSEATNFSLHWKFSVPYSSWPSPYIFLILFTHLRKMLKQSLHFVSPLKSSQGCLIIVQLLVQKLLLQTGLHSRSFFSTAITFCLITLKHSLLTEIFVFIVLLTVSPSLLKYKPEQEPGRLGYSLYAYKSALHICPVKYLLKYLMSNKHSDF